MGPIEDLTGLLEDKGIKVGAIDANPEFDACTFQAENDVGVTAIVTRIGIPGDSQRFSLAHELGHLILKTQDLDEEKAAYRFAAAFLIPEAAARSELRGKRAILSIYELHILKHKYGASMLAWIHRAEELGIISRARAKSLYQLFSARGWRKIEPGDSIPPELPRRFERMVIGAMAEGIISETRAGELLGRPVRSFLLEEAETHGEWLAEVCH